LPQQYEVILEDEFWTTFDDVAVYISANWWEASVDNFKKAVQRKISGLDLFPNGHRRWRDTNFRYCLVWDYLIFYKVDDAEHLVRVYWIMHAARDLDSLLKEKEQK